MRGRVLFLTERYAPDVGGVARSARRTAEAIAHLGWDCHVLTWTKTLPPGQLQSMSPQSDAPDAPMLHRLGLFANWDLTMQHTMNVVQWLHGRFAFDAAWGHYLYPAGFLAVTLAQTLGLASLVSARGNDVDRLMFPPGDFARLLWTLQRADAITAVSADLAHKIVVLLGRDPAVQVVHNSVDLATFSPGPAEEQLRAEHAIRPGETVLGFCGELRHKKGLPFLLGALDEVRREREACLLVIGEVRSREQAALSQYLADRSETARRVLVTGHLPSPREVARRLRLCDVVLQPSIWDGLPNALLEAMACGRIVIASDAGGIPEVIEHEVSGYMIPRHQLDRLGQATLEVLSLPESHRAALQSGARQRVAEAFHPSVEADALQALLAGVIPNSR